MKPAPNTQTILVSVQNGFTRLVPSHGLLATLPLLSLSSMPTANPPLPLSLVLITSLLSVSMEQQLLLEATLMLSLTFLSSLTVDSILLFSWWRTEIMEARQASFSLSFRTKVNVTPAWLLYHSIIETPADVSALKDANAPLLTDYLPGSLTQSAAVLAQWPGNARTTSIGMIRPVLANVRRLSVLPTKFKIQRPVNARENVCLSGLATLGKYGISMNVDVSG